MKKKLIMAMLPLLGLSAVSATISIDYDFSTTDSPSSADSGISGSGMTPGAFTGGTGVASHSTFGVGTIYVRTESTGATTPDGDTIEEAIGNGAFASFTITAGINDITLETIEWTHFTTNNDFAGADFRLYAFQESAGITAGDEVGFTALPPGAGLGDSATVSSGILALNGNIVSAGNTEEFRFYFVDNSTANSRINRLASFTVTASIPEPSAAALFGLGGLALMLRRRRG